MQLLSGEGEQRCLCRQCCHVWLARIRQLACWVVGAVHAGCHMHSLPRTVRLQGITSLVSSWLPWQDTSKFTSAGNATLGSISTASVDVLFLNGQSASVGTNAESLRAFVEAGGGLVVGAEASSYGTNWANHPANKLLPQMGIIVHSDKFT